MKPKLWLFSGLGADHRLFERLAIQAADLQTPYYPPPDRGEDLPAYAARVADRYGVGREDVVGGASLGGMLASEIAAQRGAGGLVLLGSCMHPRALPLGRRFIGVLGRLLPDFALAVRIWPPIMRWRMAPLNAEAEQVLVAMASATVPEALRRFAWMVARWRGIERPSCPILSVHGARDRVIQPPPPGTGVIIPDAGHAFTLTHPRETQAAIDAFLAGIGSRTPT